MQVAILIFIGFILLIFWVMNSAQEATSAISRKKELEAKAKEKWGDRVIDKSKSLGERNGDIVMKHLAKIRGGYQRSYYIENCVRDCIQDIAEAEGNLAMAPGYSYLSAWMNKATPEYKAVAERLLEIFRDKQKRLEAETKEKAVAQEEARLMDLERKHSGLIKQFYEIAERKVSLRDDYGDENWGVLDKEVYILLQKIAEKEKDSIPSFKDWKEYSWRGDVYRTLGKKLEAGFKAHHKAEKSRPASTVDYSEMSGVQFEGYLMKLLEEQGFTNVRGTAATGDQGADLMADKDGKRIVIQAKRYGGSVGNKAVQEVVSAVRFYSGDEGWVITNSNFTKSAKELAQRTGVRLIDGHDLKRFSGPSI